MVETRIVFSFIKYNWTPLLRTYPNNIDYSDHPNDFLEQIIKNELNQ